MVILLAARRFTAFWYRNRTYAEISVFHDLSLLTPESSLPGWVKKSTPILRSRPNNYVTRLYWRSVATSRHLGYLRVAWTGWLKYVSPPSVGEAAILCAYWVILLIMLWTNVIFKSPSALYGIEWEVVGFRAAWVSTTQLPLVYCTGCRINSISIVTGVSHERLNWFHRWTARTLFLTLIVHWGFFYREWDLSNFVQQEIALMPMVIWGFVAWIMIGFMVITGYGFLRDRFYEAWLVLHVVSAYSVLALTYTHTHCTTYFVIASVGFITFDACGRALLWVLHNIHLVTSRRGGRKFGYDAQACRLDGEYMRLDIQDVSFKWKAGQHVYVTIPHLRKLQSHPFTMVNLPNSSGNRHQMSLIIKSHRGFTRDLFQWTLEHPFGTLRTFLNGPYGNPPSLAGNDTIVMIASGNRASFVVSLLHEVVSWDHDIQRLYVHLIFRKPTDLKLYQSQLWASLKIQSATET